MYTSEARAIGASTESTAHGLVVANWITLYMPEGEFDGMQTIHGAACPAGYTGTRALRNFFPTSASDFLKRLLMGIAVNTALLICKRQDFASDFLNVGVS